jgi:hypothetical protein
VIGDASTMIGRYHTLWMYPVVFRALTGLSSAQFEARYVEVAPPLAAAERDRLPRPARRAMGAGRRSPRRKPGERPRPPKDIADNTAFARRGVAVEHTIGRLRTYQALSQTERQHRRDHPSRTRAVADLGNRLLSA